MFGHELGIQERESTIFHALNEVDEADFGSVGNIMKHGLTKECATQCHSIEATGKFTISVGLDTMGTATIM